MLGDDPTAWSKHAPLPPPAWFDEQLHIVCSAIGEAASGRVDVAREVLRTVRSDELRAWFVEHGQTSGRFRHRRLGYPTTENDGATCDTVRYSHRMETEILSRDGYRCRYCGLRFISSRVLKAFGRVMGRDVFCTRGTNQARHGVVMVFSANCDHILGWRQGGRTSLENMVSACWCCNYGKARFTLTQIGLDDPRDRPPIVSDDWDGLMSYYDALKKQPAQA